MQLHTRTNIVQQSPALDHAEARIIADAHMFKILSSAIYKHKERAVIREIACNAADAHIEVGKPDLPIEVHLPSKSDARFWIRDFGPGMAHDFVMVNYQSYGDSTKRTDNTRTGGFGTGSKSPYAYTDQFTVESVHDGVWRTYRSYVQPDGKFATDLIKEQPATDDWPSGVRITMPVKEADITTFIREAAAVFQWFNPRPTLLNGKLNYLPTTFTTEHTGLIDNSTGASIHNGLFIHMGNVGYPVDTWVLRNKYDYTGVKESLLSTCSYIRIPIGTIDIAVSRESPDYTPRTLANIDKALTNAETELTQEAIKQFNPDNLVWNDLQAARKKANNHPFLAKHLSSLLVPAYGKWRARLISDALLNDELRASEGLREDIESNIWFIRKVHDFRGGNSVRKSLIRGAGNTSYFIDTDEPNLKIFVADKPHADARIRRAISEGTLGQAVLVTPPICLNDQMSKTERRDARKAAKLRAIEDRHLLAERLLHAPHGSIDSLPAAPATAGGASKRKLSLPKISIGQLVLNKTGLNTATLIDLRESWQEEIDEAVENWNEGDDPVTFDSVLPTNHDLAIMTGSKSRASVYGCYAALREGYNTTSLNHIGHIFHGLAPRITDDDFQVRFWAIRPDQMERYKLANKLTFATDNFDRLHDWFDGIATQYNDLVIVDDSTSHFLNSAAERAAETPTDYREFMAHAVLNTPWWQYVSVHAHNSKYIAPIRKQLPKVTALIQKNPNKPITPPPNDLAHLQDMARLLTPEGKACKWTLQPKHTQGDKLDPIFEVIRKEWPVAHYWDSAGKHLSDLTNAGLLTLDDPELSAHTLNHIKV